LSGLLYDGLVDVVDRLEISNPTKLTWIYRTAKKNDRIDARKQAVLLSMDEVPRVHMVSKAICEWRRTIRERSSNHTAPAAGPGGSGKRGLLWAEVPREGVIYVAA